MEGRALSNEAIATFMKRLEESPYFENVELVETKHLFLIQEEESTPEGKRITQTKIDYDRSYKGKGAWVEEFSLTAKINYAGEIKEQNSQEEQEDN